MPWKECSVMDERLQFVARRLAGEAMAELCREFGISRKTGYKIFDRYQECGMQGLTDRSRRPYRYANQLPSRSRTTSLTLKLKTPAWVAGKFVNGFLGGSLGMLSRPRTPITGGMDATVLLSRVG